MGFDRSGGVVGRGRAVFARFFGAMLDEGALLPPSGFEAWFISMAHDEAAIAATLTAARAAFRA